MHRAVVSTKEVEKLTPLPEDLKKFKTLELLISPTYPINKAELRKKFETVFKKAKTIKIPKDIDIDKVMNEMNDAFL
jgi:hypothetical protein